MATMRPATLPGRFQDEAHQHLSRAFQILNAHLPPEALVLTGIRILRARRVPMNADFLLFWEPVGVVVLECRAWTPDEIVRDQAGRIYWHSASLRSALPVVHPLVQAQRLCDAIRLKVEQDFPQEPEALRFSMAPAVLFMGLQDRDVDTLLHTMGDNATQRPSLLSEDTLHTAARLQQALRAVPRSTEATSDRRALHAVADLLFPPQETLAVQRARVLTEAKHDLPCVTIPVAEGPPGEDSLTRYHRLRRYLLDATRQIDDLIWAEDLTGDRGKTLQKLVAALHEDVFKIGLFGISAAGKSTFLNALLGRRILREGLGETSKTVTRIKAPEAHHPDETAVLHYKTLEELWQQSKGHWQQLCAVYPDLTEGAGRAEGPSAEAARQACECLDTTAWRNHLHAVLAKAPLVASEEVRRSIEYFTVLLDGWADSHPWLGQQRRISRAESDELVHREAVATFVQERVLYIDHVLTTQKRFELIDSPGLGVTIVRHAQVAEAIAKEVDAALMLTRVDFQFMPPDERFVRNALDAQRMNERKNLIFVLNQIGRIAREQSSWEGEVERLRAKIHAIAGLSDPFIVAIDAACAFWARQAQQRPLSDQELDTYAYNYAMVDRRAAIPDPVKNLEASRFPILERELIEHLTQYRYYYFLGQKLDILEQEAMAFHGDIHEHIESLGRTLERLEEELKQHQEKRQEAQVHLDRELTYTFPAQVAEVYKDRDERIEAIIRDAAQEAARAYVALSRTEQVSHALRALAQRAVVILRDLVGVVSMSWEAFWKSLRGDNVSVRDLFRPLLEALSEDTFPWQTVDAEVRSQLLVIRQQYETDYRKVREATIARLPQAVMHTYGTDIPWHLPPDADDTQRPTPPSLVGLSDLTIGFWRGLWLDILWGFRGRAVAEQRAAQTIREKFYTAGFAERFRADLTHWIERDKDYLSAKLRETFDRLMERIGTRIAQQRDEITDTQEERALRQEILEHYQREADKALQSLNELRQQVEQARPTVSQAP